MEENMKVTMEKNVEETKKRKLRREPSHSTKFVLIGVIVFLSILLAIFIAKWAAIKTLFWLE